MGVPIAGTAAHLKGLQGFGPVGLVRFHVGSHPRVGAPRRLGDVGTLAVKYTASIFIWTRGCGW
jgi:hypothetical protein